MTESYLASTRQASEERFNKLKSDLENAERLIAGKACVYATGSFGRFEAGNRSDLDLFIVVQTQTETKDEESILVSSLDGLDEIKLKYFLISAVENMGIAKFDGGGKYLKVHSIKDFTDNLGSPEDDSKNTFTGRLLMLLESKPLLGKQIYEIALNEVIISYFKDYEDNKDTFVPAFLFNDILRMWRTFCVNYEFYRTKGSAKSKVKLFKLKYSRMLTCYSAIAYILSLFAQKGTVTPNDVRSMVSVTPTERLDLVGSDTFWTYGTVNPQLSEACRGILKLYSEFLELVHQDEDKVAEEFVGNQKLWREKSHEFARKMAEMLEIIEGESGQHPELYRFVLI